MIKPTIGRVVWVRRPQNVREQPEVGLVCYVHSDTCINVAGFDHDGQPFSEHSVYLEQDGVETPEWAGRGVRAEWMPFQKGQAAAQDRAAASKDESPGGSA